MGVTTATDHMPTACTDARRGRLSPQRLLWLRQAIRIWILRLQTLLRWILRILRKINAKGSKHWQMLFNRPGDNQYITKTHKHREVNKTLNPHIELLVGTLCLSLWFTDCSRSVNVMTKVSQK